MARGERENALQCKYNGGVVPLGFTIGKEDRLYHIEDVYKRQGELKLEKSPISARITAAEFTPMPGIERIGGLSSSMIF